ncbi:hypothetical protein BROUX41_000406 [Berkeleyomyces rouxiae]
MTTSPLNFVVPWRATFNSQVTKLPMPVFTLSTVHTPPAPSSTNDASSTSVLAPQPRARTVVFRGFWGDLPHNPHNPAKLNPRQWESDVLCITTDARMAKVDELGGDSSGGGGPFEAVFWLPEAMTQWRLRGRGYFLGRDADDDTGKSNMVRDKLQRRMRHIRDDCNGEEQPDVANKHWSWAREVTAHFGNLSPVMRGSFRNPAPGTPVSDGSGGDGLGQGQIVEDVNDPVARGNFRVVALVPDEVDYVDLSDSSKAKRWVYTAEGCEWETRELWP